MLTDLKESPGQRLGAFFESLTEASSSGHFFIRTTIPSRENSVENNDDMFVSELADGEDGIMIYDNSNHRKSFHSNMVKFLDN